MDQQLNRVEQAVKTWNDTEKRYRDLFGIPIKNDRQVLKEKLLHFEDVVGSFNKEKTLNKDERSALRVLNKQRRDLTRQLYPSLFFRLLRRAAKGLVKLVSAAIVEVKEIQEKQLAKHHYENLKNDLNKNGYAEVAKSLDHHIEGNKPAFSIPKSPSLSGSDWMENSVKFEKDEYGKYQIHSIQTRLVPNHDPSKAITNTIAIEDGLIYKPDQIRSLMQGKAVFLSSEDGEVKNGIWKQLDFNDKDAAGNLKVRTFPPEYGYDAKKEFDQVFSKHISKGQRAKITDKLSKGESAEMSIEKDGKKHTYYVDANPQLKSFIVYDQAKSKTTISEAIGNKDKVVNQTHEKSTTQKTAHQKKASSGLSA